MKYFLMALLLSTNVSARMNKCVVDGKTSYQSAPCSTAESERVISDKSFTNGMSTDGLRKEIARNTHLNKNNARNNRMAELQAIALQQPHGGMTPVEFGNTKRRAKAAQRMLDSMMGNNNSAANELDDSLKKINRKLNQIKNNAEQKRIQDSFKQYQ